MNASRRIHLWVPELSGTGGIQKYSRALLRGLAELLPGTSFRVLAKNDDPDSLPDGNNISYHACGRISLRWRTARFSALLIQQTLAHRPDLAILTHLHFAPVAAALKRLTGLRYWVAAHGLEAWGAKSRLLQRALAGAEKILPVGRYTQQRLLQSQPLDESRLFLLPNVVDEASFYPTAKPAHLLRRYGLGAGQKIVFTLARLSSRERYKGYDLVLDALAQTRAHVPDVHYLLAGRGDDTARIRRDIRQRGLEKHVTLTGFLPDRDLRDHYNLCDLFVMPSRGEGFGIVYLEALACGRPVVAGNEDGARDPLLDGEVGALVDPHDSAALADTMVRGLLGQDEHPHLYNSTYLRRRVVEQFGFGAFRERLRALLHI